MFQTFQNVFKITELRNKVLFTLSMILVFRIGHYIFIPGVNQEQLAKLMSRGGADGWFTRLADAVSMLSVGQLSQATLFGLGIMPYITAGIIFQLLATVLPQLKKLQEEGPTGRQKIMEYTRYVTIILCVFQGAGYLAFLRQSNLVYLEWYSNPLWWIMAISALSAGCLFLMWLGEQIDKHGIGNGASMIIMAGILAGMPQAIRTVWNQFSPGEPNHIGYMGLFLLVAGFVGVIACTVLMTVAQRRIPVQQAKHTRGRKVFGGQKSYLPLRLNHGGVMPIIFASSIMIFPTVILGQFKQLLQGASATGFWATTVAFLDRNFAPGHYLYIITYIVMVYFFSYFWITVQFNPEDMSKQLKEHGSFIPGLRPGPRTAEYLETVMNRITFVGAAFLSLVAVLPAVVNQSAGIDYAVTQFLGGTGLLIVVSVSMDFLQRVEANLLMRNYQGFLGGADGDGGPRMRGPRG
jgi:preprotein translocase subunit SecY